MIYVTLGSQKFQFNRLLKALDDQIEQGLITDGVFAQIGYSDYKPVHYEYVDYLDRNAFLEQVEKSDIVIAHGGTGAIIGALKHGKKVIAVPRLSKYGEHVDDHQLQLVEEFSNLGLILECKDCDKIWDCINMIKKQTFNEYHSNTQRFIDSIVEYIEGISNHE